MGLRKVRIKAGQVVQVDEFRAKAIVDGGLGEYADGLETKKESSAATPEAKRRKAAK